MVGNISFFDLTAVVDLANELEDQSVDRKSSGYIDCIPISDLWSAHPEGITSLKVFLICIGTYDDQTWLGGTHVC